MRIARIALSSAPSWVELDEDGVFELPEGPFCRPTRRGTRVNAHDCEYLAPVENHNKIVGLMGNFMGRGERKGPGFFFKPYSAVIGDGATIVKPSGVPQFNFEAELGVVIGRHTSQVLPEQALEHVWGYTIVNDVTSFPVMEADGPFSTRWKGYDTFCPVGPHIVKAERDPAELRMSSRLNGVVKQDVVLSQMDFSVPEVVAWVSAAVSLAPGDIISMGTPPGFEPMEPGDVIECEIETIGSLRNPIGLPSQRAGTRRKL